MSCWKEKHAPQPYKYLIENKVEPDGKWTSVRLDFYLIAIQNDSIFITRPLLRNVYSMRTLFHVPL